MSHPTPIDALIRPPVRRMLIALAAAVTALSVVAASASASDTQYLSNTSKISIGPNIGKANPYPTGILVSGVAGRVDGVAVTLRGVQAEFAGDMDLLLVAPSGKAVVLASDVCGLKSLSPQNWTFSSFATDSLPADAPCYGGIYRPTDRPPNPVDDPQAGGADRWPGAPIAGTPTTDLDSLVGDDPNGSWRLYAYDDRNFKGASIASGWTLSLSTVRPDATFPANQAGKADPFPIVETTFEPGKVITDVNVSQSGIYHERPQDLDLVLEGPNGAVVRLMDRACGSGRVPSAFWGWDDEAPATMPAGGPCADGFYRPSPLDQGAVDMDAPAPAGPYGSSLDAFDGLEASGVWRLYARDTAIGGDNGFFRSRFVVSLTTRDKSPVSFETAALRLVEGGRGELVVTRPKADAPGPADVKLDVSGAGADIAPLPATAHFARGERRVTVPVRALADAQREGEETAKVTLSDPQGDAALGTPVTATVAITDPAEPKPNPATGGGGTNGGGGDHTAPRVAGLRLTPTRFRAQRPHRKPVKGTKIRFRLSERATATLRFQKRVACKSKRKGCVRWVSAGVLRKPARKGANAFAFRGRIGPSTLKSGSYRLRLTATDRAGNETTTRARAFRVVR